MVTFSIVIPIYNAEKYLRACLDSIVAQSYTDFEAIMIDDGSEDGSAAICKEYAERDHRFTYRYKENGGVSTARNAGIEIAKGEWMLFIDSDDVLLPDSLAIFSKMCSNAGTDMVMGTYILDSYIPKECFKETQTFNLLLDKNAVMELMFLTHKYNYQGYVWNKAFRTSIIKENKLHFDTAIYFNEDRLFCVEYICKMTGKARFSSLPVYHYYKRQTGAMGSITQKYNHNLMTDYDSSVTILRLLQSNGFPLSIIRLGYDRLIDSYDIIRHAMKNMRYEYADEKIEALKERTISTVGTRFYIGCRIRRFLSKQYYNVFKKRVYLR